MLNKHSAIKLRSQAGFTLIEILVVITIMSITLGMAVLAFGDFGASRRITVEAEQLQNMIKLAQQQAILESGTLGMDINKTNYQVYRLILPSTWTPITKPHVFRSHPFPKDTSVRLSVPFIAPDKTPDIIINSSGDITPFTLQLGTKAKPAMVKLVGQPNGNLELSEIQP